ncbi:MAG: L-fucose/L-arabinose isomerase family protein [Spirochaetota bacterium]
MRGRKKKVGVITLSLERERTDLAEKFGRGSIRALKSEEFEVLGDETLIFDTVNCIEKVNEFRKMGADCILILLGTWVFTPTVVDTVREVNLPFGIWSEDNPASFSLTAGGIVHGSLDELGLRHRFFYGSPASRELIEEVSSFIRAAAAVNDLKGKRLCVVGGRVMGMYTTMGDLVQLKDVFGVEVEHIDAVRLYLEAERIPIEEVNETWRWVSSTFGSIDKKMDEGIIQRSIRLYLALKKILQEEQYSLVAVKCQDEMINRYASSCLAVSLLNDDGLTVSCESDINAAITMSVLSSISGGVSLFGDVNHVDLDQRILRIVNCGSMPTTMARDRKEVDIGLQYEYMGKARGATTVFSVREAPVTMARLSRIGGKFVMLAFEGNTLEAQKSRFEEARGQWPHAFVQLGCDCKKLVQNFRSNHIHACFGHHLRELEEFCKIKEIEITSL